MPIKKNLKGMKFGDLTVIEELEERKNSSVLWKCKCSCGNYIKTTTRLLNSKHSKSCGCKRIKSISSHKLSNHRLYNIWRGMKQRCYNKNHDRYKDYGDRGISICKEWKNDFKSFYDWAIKNGYKDNLTIERINNNKEYCPDNCKWITNKDQSFNRRRKKKFINTPVGIVRSAKKYGATIKVNGKQIWLGTFDTKNQAIYARNKYIKNNKLQHRINLPIRKE